jgi:hypothetical protein
MFMLCCRFERLDTVERQCGGEGVSQSPLKDNAFSTLLDQNPPLELPPENGVLRHKAPFHSGKIRKAGLL